MTSASKHAGAIADHRRRERRRWRALALFALATSVSLVLDVATGPSLLPPGEVLRSLSGLASMRRMPGDTITFVPGNSGHFVQSHAVPDGAKAWKSAVDERLSVVLEQEGVYLHVCPPHLMMSMIGAIQVGRAGNIEDVESRAAKLRPKLVMKGERLDAALAQVVAD